jgi:DNA ligase (NAD+)
LKGAIEHFASKAALNVEGLGRKTVAQLVEQGLVNDLADLYQLRFEQLMKLEGFATRSSTLLLEALTKSKSVSLARFLIGLGIRHVGEHVAKVLAREFGSLDAIMSADLDRFQGTKAIGPEISASLVSYFQESSNRRVITRLREIGLTIEETSTAEEEVSRTLAGKSFVFTGGLSSLSRADAAVQVEQRGGTVSSSVSKKTSYLVAGSDPGSKLDQARKAGVTILNEQEFVELLTRKAEPS